MEVSWMPTLFGGHSSHPDGRSWVDSRPPTTNAKSTKEETVKGWRETIRDWVWRPDGGNKSDRKTVTEPEPLPEKIMSALHALEKVMSNTTTTVNPSTSLASTTKPDTKPVTEPVNPLPEETTSALRCEADLIKRSHNAPQPTESTISKTEIGFETTTREEIDARVRPLDDEERFVWSYNPEAKPKRSCLKRSTVQADDSTTPVDTTTLATTAKATTKRSVSFGHGLNEMPDWDARHFAGPKSRAPMWKEKAAAQVYRDQRMKWAAAISEIGHNPIFSYTPTATETLKEDFPKLFEHGTELTVEDRRRLSAEELKAWDEQDEERRNRRLLLLSELPAVMQKYGTRDEASYHEDYGLWAKHALRMANEDRRAIFPTVLERQNYLNCSGDKMPREAQVLTKAMSETKSKNDAIKRKYVTERLKRKGEERINTRQSDKLYQTLLPSARSDLEEYGSELFSDDEAVFSTARQRYLKKLRGKIELLPFEADQLYDELVLGDNVMSVLDTLEGIWTQENPQSTQQWNPKALPDHLQLMLQKWLAQRKAMSRRGQSIITAETDKGREMTEDQAASFRKLFEIITAGTDGDSEMAASIREHFATEPLTKKPDENKIGLYLCDDDLMKWLSKKA
jgi:hypothetical protein